MCVYVCMCIYINFWTKAYVSMLKFLFHSNWTQLNQSSRIFLVSLYFPLFDNYSFFSTFHIVDIFTILYLQPLHARWVYSPWTLWSGCVFLYLLMYLIMSFCNYYVLLD